MHTSSRSKALRALHSASGFSRRSSRKMWAALLASCQVWGISSVLNNPLPADTNYTLFPPFLFSLIHPIKKHVTRTRYGHRYGHSSSPACAHAPKAGEPGQKLPPGTNWEEGKGYTTAAASQGKGVQHPHGDATASLIPHALPANEPFEHLGSAPCLASDFQCELMQVLGLFCASKT